MLKLAAVFLSAILFGVCDAQQECQEGVVYENGTTCVDLIIVLPGNEAAETKLNFTVSFKKRLSAVTVVTATGIIFAGNSTMSIKQCDLDPCKEYLVNIDVYDDRGLSVITYQLFYNTSAPDDPTTPTETSTQTPTTNGTIRTTATNDPPTTSATTTTVGPIGLTCSEGRINNYTFPSQRPGFPSYSVETCKGGVNISLASIRCSSQGVYDLNTLQTSRCESIGFVISQNFTNSTLKDLEILTAKPEALNVENVTDVSEYLFNISRLNVTFSESQIGEAAEISSHLTAYYRRDEVSTTDFVAEKQKLVRSITNISRKVEFDSGTSSVTKLSDDVNIEVREVKRSTEGNTDYTFNATFYENDEANSTSVPISIKIPAEAFNIAQRSSSSNIRIVSVGYRSSFLFPSTRTSDWVISSSLGDSSDTVEGISLSNSSIVITNDRTEEPGKKKVDDFKAELVELECVFWNFTIGNWSSEGCTLSKSSPPTCHCNHLTNFAILVSRSEIPADYALTVVTYVGCGLSIICFIATLLVICVSRRLRARYQMRILGNICFCLALAFALFVFGVDHRVDTVNCSVLTVFMHFFFLAAWFWMSVYSYTIYRDIVKVMMSYGRTFKFRFAALFAYGVPLLIVLINSSVSLGHIDQDFPDDPKAVSSYRAQNFCWLRLYSLYFGFLLPVGILLLFNIVVFCFVIPEITCKRQKIQSSDKKSGSGRNAVTIIVLVTTMGLTWVFGYLMLVSDNMSFLLAMSWLFTIITCFQGVFIFYFTAVRSGELGRLCAPINKRFSTMTTVSTGASSSVSETRNQTGSD